MRGGSDCPARAAQGTPARAHGLKFVGAAWLAGILLAAACHRGAAPVDAEASAPGPALRFSADADSAGVTVMALDGTIRLDSTRARVRVEVGSYSQSWVPGSLTLAYARIDSSGNWHVLTAGAPLAADRWVLRPGMVWVPLELELPLPPDDGRSRGRLVFIVERHRPDLPVDAPERWFVPVEVRR